MIKIKSPNTLSSILKTFNKALNDLETLIAQNGEQVSVNNVKIETIQEENQKLRSETARAAKVADNLKALIQE